MKTNKRVKGYHRTRYGYYVRKTIDGYQESFGTYKKEEDAQELAEKLKKLSYDTLRKIANVYENDRERFYEILDFHPYKTSIQQIYDNADFDEEFDNEINKKLEEEA